MVTSCEIRQYLGGFWRDFSEKSTFKTFRAKTYTHGKCKNVAEFGDILLTLKILDFIIRRSCLAEIYDSTIHKSIKYIIWKNVTSL